MVLSCHPSSGEFDHALCLFVARIVERLYSHRRACSRADRDHDLTVEDYFTIANISSCRVSPDGGHVAYVESRWEPERDARNNDLWVVSTDGLISQRLTFDPAAEGAPQWSPDGMFVYFTTQRKRSGEDHPPFDGSTQVWRMRSDGTDLMPVTRVAGGVDGFELSADGRSIFYLVSTEHIDDAWKSLREEYKSLKYGHGVMSVSELWRLDLHTWRARKLLADGRVIRALSVAPNGQRVALLTTPDEELIFHEGASRIDIYDVDSNATRCGTPDGWRVRHASPFGWIDGLQWSGDSEAVAFTISFDGYPTRVYTIEVTDEAVALAELDRPKGDVTVVGGTMQWGRGDAAARDLCFIGEHHARARVYRATVRDGQHEGWAALTPGDVVVSDYAMAQGGELIVIAADPTQPPDLFRVEVGHRGDFVEGYYRLTRVNPQVDTWKIPQMQIVSWTGANGDTVEGILELPPDYQPGQRLPLVVELHGGPTSATQFYFRFWIYGRALMPAQGYALLSPNYRGSTGYGDKFMVELIGRENDIEVEDILKGVHAMIEAGIADPERMAVMGWSNGGFLTNCLITKTDMFKAASSGAGVFDQTMQWAIEDTPGHVINYMQSLPWKDPQAYLHGSPVYGVDKVKTPTLIHVGEHDARVPAAHARALYRSLKHYLDVPAELVIYPGEGHGLTTYKHRKAKMLWDVAWFKRYCLGQDDSAGE